MLEETPKAYSLLDTIDMQIAQFSVGFRDHMNGFGNKGRDILSIDTENSDISLTDLSFGQRNLLDPLCPWQRLESTLDLI